MDIELSQVDSAVRVGDFPGFLKRQTSTAINAVAGDTIAIAGLLLRERGRDRTAVPGLGALPVAGALFRSQRRQQRETELLVLITPYRFDAGTPAVDAPMTQPAMIERAGELQQDATAHD